MTALRSSLKVFVARAMTYSKLQKFNHKTDKYECFFPLRVVGLAYELGHNLAEKHGACGGVFELTEGRSFGCTQTILGDRCSFQLVLESKTCAVSLYMQGVFRLVVRATFVTSPFVRALYNHLDKAARLAPPCLQLCSPVVAIRSCFAGRGLRSSPALCSASSLRIASSFPRHGPCSLQWEQLRSVKVSGDVRWKDDGCWRKTRSYTLTVNKEDAELARTVVQKQLSLLTVDLRLNVSRVDPSGAAGSLDLLGYFVRDAYNCAGRVWVELKLWGKATFNESFLAEQTALEERFPVEQRKDKSLTGVLLVVGVNIHMYEQSPPPHQSS